MTHAGPLSVRIVSDLNGWQALQPWWDTLLEASTDSTPWQTFDYLWCWWQHLREARQLRIIVVESAGVPVMIFPLQITRETMMGLPLRLIEPITMMWDVNRPRFALGAPDMSLLRFGLDADRVPLVADAPERVEELPLSDPQAQELEALAAREGLWFRDVLSSVCPYLSLEQPWDAFLKSRGPRLRKNLRAALRRLESHGPVRLDVRERPEDIARAFDVVMSLHQRSWKRRKHVGLSLSVPFRDFFRAFLFRRAAQGRACVLTLWAADRPVAATIAFVHQDTYFSTEIVHDAAFAHCSPGTLLESMELERLMRARQQRCYDFLGRFLSNKQRWTDTARVTHRIYVFRPGLVNALVELHYFRAKPLIKRGWRAVFGLSRATAQAMRFMPRT